MAQFLHEKSGRFRLPRWLVAGFHLVFAAGAGAEDYPALWGKAALKAAAGQVEEAEAMLRQAVQDRPKLAEAWHGLADFLLYYGRNEEAEAAFQGALRLEPNRAESINMLGVVIALDASRIGVAETLYRRAISIDPDLPAPWINLGNLLQDHREKYAEAETAYRWALKLDESIPEAWNGLGNTLNRLDRHSEAEKAFKRAIRLARTRTCGG